MPKFLVSLEVTWVHDGESGKRAETKLVDAEDVIAAVDDLIEKIEQETWMTEDEARAGLSQVGFSLKAVKQL